MDAEFGKLLDTWGAIIPGRGSLLEPLEDEVLDKVEAKDLENVTISWGLVRFGDPEVVVGRQEVREHLIITQTMSGGRSNTLALRISLRGAEDLELSWRLFGRGGGAETWRWIGMIGITVVPAICILFSGAYEAALCAMGGLLVAGVLWLIFWASLSKRRGSLSTYQLADAKALAAIVDHALMSSLNELAVSGSEIRVLHHSRMEGMGILQ